MFPQHRFREQGIQLHFAPPASRSFIQSAHPEADPWPPPRQKNFSYLFSVLLPPCFRRRIFSSHFGICRSPNLFNHRCSLLVRVRWALFMAARSFFFPNISKPSMPSFFFSPYATFRLCILPSAPMTDKCRLRFFLGGQPPPCAL